MTLIEHDEVLVSGDTVVADRALVGLLLVPWIICTRCDKVLARVHNREAWGDLSYLARHYAITTPDRTVVARLFPADSADEAFASLLQSCDQPSTPTDSHDITP